MSRSSSLRLLSAMKYGTGSNIGFGKYACQMSTLSASHVVDLRSDTVTRPTPEMRQVMKDALVGDDVMREDPTINELQRVFAKRVGKEAALFVPTCTMANTIAVMVHCDGRFNEVILGDQSHIHHYEVAAVAQFINRPECKDIRDMSSGRHKSLDNLGGVQVRCVKNLPDGTMDLQDIESSVRVTNDDHQPWTKLICLENTQNRCGGKVIPIQYMHSVRQLADKHNLKVHLDGARVFNAAVALGVPVSDITAPAHSVSTAFTKGLCCPVGSMVAGSQDFIDSARRVRKALGGGMRQAGVIGAPALLALDTMVDRLKDDHLRAKRIAEAVQSMKDNPVCRVDLEGVHTNIVMIEMIGSVTPAKFSKRLHEVTEQEKKSLGESISVLLFPFTKTKVRYVVHHDISDEDVEKVERKIKYVIEDFSK